MSNRLSLCKINFFYKIILLQKNICINYMKITVLVLLILILLFLCNKNKFLPENFYSFACTQCDELRDYYVDSKRCIYR